MEEQLGTTNLRKQQTIPSKYAGLGAAITVELTVGSWFGVGVILAVGVADDFNYFVRVVTRGK